jgi:hypothetical protein
MMGIFRTATGQAIEDIITENAQNGTFGVTLSHADLQIACGKIVDLFEMTLELRGHTQNLFGGALGAAVPKNDTQNSMQTRAQNFSQNSSTLAGVPKTPTMPRTSSTLRQSLKRQTQGSESESKPVSAQKPPVTSLVSGVANVVGRVVSPFSTQLPRKRTAMTSDEKDQLKK